MGEWGMLIPVVGVLIGLYALYWARKEGVGQPEEGAQHPCLDWTNSMEDTMAKRNDDCLGDEFDSIKKAVQLNHSRITEIDSQIATLSQERALIRADAIRELQATLRLPTDLIGHLVAGCR